MLIVLCQAVSTPSWPLQIIDHQYAGGLLHFWILLKLKLENYAPTEVKECFHSHIYFFMFYCICLHATTQFDSVFNFLLMENQAHSVQL